MARYQLILAYDGSGFAGSQRQAKPRTVQGELEKSLRKIGWSGLSVIMAGRTDTGVHAMGQVVAFDLDWVHTLDELQKALNARLPSDLVVRDLTEASKNFHPRFDAVSRRYRYQLFCEKIRDPLRERFAWRVWPEVDGDILNRVAAEFPGSHDFSSFGSPTSRSGNTWRTVISSVWTNVNGEWQFEVRADAFLYRMVRRMVFVQVSAAQGKCLAEEIRKALNGQGKLPAGLAPAQGLTLVEVSYENKERRDESG
jgi:tRNA pseudouridine38-40 synthase